MIVINKNICDNAKECSGIEVCPTGAIFWDEANESIATNDEMCVSCGKCVTEGCPIEAIIIVETEEEKDNELAKIAAEDRTPEDLFVERYGAQPIDGDLLIEYQQIESVLQENVFTLVELFNDNSIQCLAHSIPISEIQRSVLPGALFYKCDVGENNITSLVPSLVVYYGSKQLGIVEGYFTDEEKDIFFEKIRAIIENK